MRGLGGGDVRVIPSGVGIPESVVEPEEPPHVLYVGRLSEEKGVRDLAEAASGLPLVVVGDGPLRDVVQSVGPSPTTSSAPTTTAPPSSASPRGARATASSRGRRWRTRGRSSPPAWAACRTRSMTASPVSSSRPGTWRRCGPHSSGCSRTAPLRRQLGTAARAKAEAELSWPAATAATLAVYEQAAGQAT